MQQENELDKLFNDLKTDSPKFEEKPEEKVEEKPEEKEEVEEVSEQEPRKNRKHRRWEKSLHDKEMALAVKEARLQALQEAKISTADIDPRLLTLYGDNENGRLAAKLTSEILRDTAAQARQEAIREFKEEQSRALAEQKQYESMIDDKLEDLEESFNVDLTSNAPAAKKARREYLEMVQKFSPKDEQGNITSYADFDSVFEMYQSSKKQPSQSRSKELADRSMTNSSPNSQSQSKEEKERERAYLRSIGLNV